MPDNLLPVLSEIFFKLSSVLAIVFGGLLVTVVCKKIIRSFFAASKKKFPQNNYDTLSTVLVSVVKYGVYFFMAVQLLAVFGASMESILAVAGVGSIALGFGAKGIIEDFITGMYILFENQFQVGDMVEINGKSGAVESIGLRTTIIRSFEGDVHIFPNSTIRLVTNMSKAYNRAVVEVKVPYQAPLEKVLAILEDEMANAKADGLLTTPTVLGVSSMDHWALTIRINADCQVGKNWSVERALRRLIKVRFEKEGIDPPCPPLPYTIDETKLRM